MHTLTGRLVVEAATARSVRFHPAHGIWQNFNASICLPKNTRLLDGARVTGYDQDDIVVGTGAVTRRAWVNLKTDRDSGMPGVHGVPDGDVPGDTRVLGDCGLTVRVPRLPAASFHRVVVADQPKVVVSAADLAAHGWDVNLGTR